MRVLDEKNYVPPCEKAEAKWTLEIEVEGDRADVILDQRCFTCLTRQCKELLQYQVNELLGNDQVIVYMPGNTTQQ